MNIFTNKIILIFAIVLTTKLFILFIVPVLAVNFLSINRAQNSNFLESWNIRDAPHYQSIAEYGYLLTGYESNYIVFFPFFPFTIYIFKNILQIGFLQASFLIATSASFILAIFLYKLIHLDHNGKIASRTVMLIFIYPASFFLHIPYSESIFLLLAILAFYFMRRKLFLFSSIVIMFATATRIHGLALILPFFIECFDSKMELMKRKYQIPFLVFFPFLGFIVYLLINYYTYNNYFHFIKVQQDVWQNHFSLYGGFSQAISFINNPNDYRNIDGFVPLALGYFQLFAVILFLGIMVWGYRKIRRSYYVYMFLIFALSYPTSFWRSMPRFLLVAFPIFLILAIIIEKRKVLRYFVYISFLVLWLIYSAVALVDYSIS